MLRARFWVLTVAISAIACDRSDPAGTADEVGVDSAAPIDTGTVDSTVADSTFVDSTAPDGDFSPDATDTSVDFSCDATTKYVGEPASDAGFLDTGIDASADGDAEAGASTCPPIESTGFKGLFGAGDSLYASNGCLYQSTDASHWRRLPTPPGYLTAGVNPGSDYVVSKGKLWALTWVLLSDGASGWGETLGLWRLDGEAWTFVSRPTSTEPMAFGGGDRGFVISYMTYEIAPDGAFSYGLYHLLSSTDGISFTDTVDGVAPHAFGNGLTVLGGGSPTSSVTECDYGRAVIVRSNDGVTWNKAKTTPTPLLDNPVGGSVVEHDDRVVGFVLDATPGAKSTLIATSTDGGSTFRLEIDSRALNGLATNGSTFVMVGDGGTILTNDDLTKPWTARASGTSARLTSVAALGTGFVAVAPKDGSAAAIVLQSPDGITWSEKPITALAP